jgi:hypothetical protein
MHIAFTVVAIVLAGIGYQAAFRAGADDVHRVLRREKDRITKQEVFAALVLLGALLAAAVTGFYVGR